MRRCIIIAGLLVLTAVLVTAYSFAAAPAPVTRLTAADHERTIDVKKGGLVEVALPGNPTTGYQWQAVPGDGYCLKQSGEAEFAADSGLLGAGGTVTLTFEAVTPGTCPLTLIYHRAFEPGTPPLHTFSVTVKVN